jgi:hypothetical protein
MNNDGVWKRLWRLQERLELFLVFVLVFLDISIKRLLKQPLHNHTHLFISTRQNMSSRSVSDIRYRSDANVLSYLKNDASYEFIGEVILKINIV